MMDSTPLPLVSRERLGRKRGCLFFFARGLLAVVGLVALLMIAGAVFQSAASANEQRNFVPPGQLIAVDGHLMHLRCVGEGSPTVVLEAGAYGFSAEWYWVQQQLAETNRVCAYDRAGMGWSEPVAGARTLLQGAQELHALLAQAGEPGPYVLAGHSYGGIRIRVYATEYPDEVAGLVMVDSALNTLNFEEPGSYDQYKRDNDLLNAPVWLLVRTGLARLTAPSTYSGYGYPEDAAALIAAFRSGNQAFDTYYAEGIAAMEANAAQAEMAEELGDLPLAVLWATVLPRILSPQEAERYAALQAEVAGFSTNSVTRPVDGADHGTIIGREQYARQVSEAIRDVIVAAQTGDPLGA